MQIDWMCGGESALLSLSIDRSCAENVAPGVYTIRVEDAEFRVGECVVEVHMTNIPIIIGYRITHASCDRARDGKIEVLFRNLRGNKFLWTNGVVTVTPELQDVAPGKYTATPLYDDNPYFIHACDPAVVLPSRNSVDNV
jgi:hypothetical protein